MDVSGALGSFWWSWTAVVAPLGTLKSGAAAVAVCVCIVEPRLGCRDEEDAFRGTCITGIFCIASGLVGGVLRSCWRCGIALVCNGFSAAFVSWHGEGVFGKEVAYGNASLQACWAF